MINVLVQSQVKDGAKIITMKIGEGEAAPLVFDSLVKLSQEVLEAKIHGKDQEYKATCTDTSLQFYCDTINGVISDVLADTELQKVYQDNSLPSQPDSPSPDAKKPE